MKALSLPIALAISGTLIFASPAFTADFSTKNTQTSKKDDEGIVTFTPPTGWFLADSSALPPSVKIMVIGKGQHPFPPSMNLATQPYKGTLKQYLRNVKSINDSQKTEFKDLGTIRTEAGNANLSQVDRKTEWGDERLMHVILLKNETIYILTASALKEEFSRFYKDFFNAMRSLRINQDVFEMVAAPQRRNQLKASVESLQNQWKNLLSQQLAINPTISIEDLRKTLFEGEQFQATAWNPFKDMLKQKFADMGPEWQSFMLQRIENDLFDINL